MLTKRSSTIGKLPSMIMDKKRESRAIKQPQGQGRGVSVYGGGKDKK